MQAAIQADKVSFIGMYKQEGQSPIMNIHVHRPVMPTNLVISCENNIVTITAEPVGEVTIEYRFNYEGEYVTYTEPFAITETVIVSARAMTKDGSINRNQQCEYVEPTGYSTSFYIEDISGSDNSLQIRKNNDSAPTLTIQKSTDGTTWTSMGNTSTTALEATVPANGKLYLRCNTNAWSVSSSFYYNTITTTGNCNVGGNIMSLLYGSNFTGNETTFPSGSTYNFRSLFYYNTHLVNASDLLLPATALTDSCYQYMFCGCTALTTAPALPATTLANDCYQYMFYGCSLLTTAPALPATTLTNYCYHYMFRGTALTTAPALPATTLAQGCYEYMFENCTSLTTAPALPATTLVQECYKYMFQYCTSLTTAPALPATTLAQGCYDCMFRGCTALTTAPALPATTLANDCYQNMFNGCTALTTAPTLPATTLAQGCYSSMLQGCTKLNYIKCLATDISANRCTQGWVYGVATTGTFVKDPSMESWTTGTNGIPSGWTVTSKGIILTQSLNVATIQVNGLDTGTGYYTINGGSQISLSEGTTTIAITQAMNGQTLLVYGEFDSEPAQETLTLSWINYAPSVTITETDNYVTISAPNADSITYRLGSSGEYTNYTSPVYIASDTTIYVIATRTVSGVVYTTEKSQAVTHTLMPPTNLTITCSNNTVTITADNATTIEYNTDGSSTYTTYTEPFKITETVTVYARATNVDGSITASQECVYNIYGIPFYIEDISGSTNTVQIKKMASAAPTLTIQKSTDGITWESMGNTSTTALEATVPANGKLYLRCNTNQWGNKNAANNHNYINTTGNCNVGGNIMSLLYGSSFTGNETTFSSGTDHNLFGLFRYNTHIINTNNLLLPATSVTNYCYGYMFQSCTSLITAPTLPATTVTNRCYQSMFQNCTSLATAPALPATTLAERCYEYMFSGCTALTTAPVLSATTAGSYCCYMMFNGCTALTTAPALPATTLATYCYLYMFNGCTSLTTAPALPATTLTASCYEQMFNNCTSLVTAPVLPATTLANLCYCYMFYGCSSLTAAPTLPATTLTTSCYNGMFSGCTALTTAPELPATTLGTSCYQYMFQNCTNLNYIKCLATNISASSCTNEWVNGVAASGTFIKNPEMESWTTGISGIPTNWVVRDPAGIQLSQELNVATIEMTELDSGTGYYTINGGSQVSLSEGTTNVPITQAMNGQTLLAHGEFNGEPMQETLTLSWVDYAPSVTITNSNNYVTITSETADTIQYRLGSSGEYTTYTTPVYIDADTTIYVIATKTVSGVVYTTNTSQEVEHVLIPPSNLVISCSNNFVTITATGAATLEYNTDGSSTYTTYTAPFAINQTVTVYAKATNSDGSITASQQCTYVDYRPAVTITESNNYVTISAPNANSITYRLGSSGEYSTYTTPVYIASDTTIYVIATRTVSGVVYTTEKSQAVTHTLIPPTNLVISCSNGIVTITATNATTIEYNMDGSSTYTTYTEPFKITETVTVYARATNADGSITASQECVYDNYIDTLKSMGCHFWAPLDENDITEKLSETSPTHRAGQLTWDSAKDAYKFKTSSNNQQVLVYNITNVNNLSSTLAYTIIADIWCVSNNGTMDFYTCGQTATSDGSVSCSTCQTHRFTGFTNGSWHRMMQTVSGNTLKFYIDGSCVRTDNSSWGSNLKPKNWTAASIRNYTTIGNQWSNYSFEGYIKNVYLFDHVLTSDEINSLQFR